jgi:isoquinoline 1-oxidoreductase subunit beta
MPQGRGPNRRLFVMTAAAVGGGLMLGLRATPADARDPMRRDAITPENELNVWVVVRPDDTVVIRVVRSELGQGTLTGLAQLVAEELDCDWSRVKVEQPSPQANLGRVKGWRDFSTTQSRGIRTSQDYLRLAGASARWMLLQAAAAQWKVPAMELMAENGIITHTPTGRTLSFGRLTAAAARLKPPEPRTIKPDNPDHWLVAGKPIKRLDLAEKLTGKAIYGIDVTLPGMLNAAIRQAPVFGSSVLSYDAKAVAGMPGVRHVLQVGDQAVAVVADSWWQAEQAISRLPVTWTDVPEAKASSGSIADYLREGLDARDAFIGHTHGDALKAIAGAAKRAEAVYSFPFAHHATLEPMNCTALWSGDRIEVWTATQNAEAALRTAADAAGVPPSAAALHRCAAGGSFGRRLRHDFIRQAVLIARQVPDRPVKLVWSRAQDTQHGYYRPPCQFKVSGGVDEKGDLTGLIVRISGPSVSAFQTPQSLPTSRDARMFHGLYTEAGEAQLGYSIPNLYIDHAMRPTHVPVGFWRGAHLNQNAFMLECFVDELARAAERDPLDFRRAQMKSHPRHLTILTAAAEKGRWGLSAPAGVYRGLAQCMGFGSYTAAVAEVSIDADNAIRVHRVVVAIDCGQVVNPDLVSAQIEGSVAFALGAMFHQEITIDAGAVVERDFDSHGVISLREMPIVETVLVPSGEAWGGVGSAAVAVVAPAIANAVAAASGKRIRALPVRGGKID